jgi:hypothetical protein
VAGYYCTPVSVNGCVQPNEDLTLRSYIPSKRWEIIPWTSVILEKTVVVLLHNVLSSNFVVVGGLVVIVLAIGPKAPGLKPCRERVRLPSEGT